MKSKTIIGLVIGVIVIVAGAYYFMGSGKTLVSTDSNSTGTTGSTNGTQTTGSTGATGGTKPITGPTATSGKFDGSVAALIKRGGDWKCNIDTTTTSTISSGEVFVSGGKFRGNFSTTVKGFGDVRSYMISDGTTAYTWSTAASGGVKMPVAKSGLTGGTTSGQGVDVNQSYTYTCEPWSVDQTIFIPPSTVTFTEVK